MSEANTISKKINERIESFPSGVIFSIDDFFDIANENTVKSALLRMTRRGHLVRIYDGLYTRLRYNRITEKFTLPNPSEFAKKIAAKFKWRTCPSKNTALKLVGFDVEIENTLSYVTDGAYRKYTYQGWTIEFKLADPKYVDASYSNEFLILIQAIKTFKNSSPSIADLSVLTKYSRRVPEDLVEASENFSDNVKRILRAINENRYDLI